MVKYGVDGEEYYETKNIGTKARSHKQCRYCKGTIIMGEPHCVHYFGTDYYSVPTHKDCEDEFLKAIISK